MRLFSIEIPIVATAYIKAETLEDALNIANCDLADTSIEFSDRYQGLNETLCIDGRPYPCLLDNDEEIALSPAMSLNQKSYKLEDLDEVEDAFEDDGSWKVFFASLTDPSLEVDAWVPTLEQGLVILKALAKEYADHMIMMRARLKRFRDYEERTVAPGRARSKSSGFSSGSST